MAGAFALTRSRRTASRQASERTGARRQDEPVGFLELGEQLGAGPTIRTRARPPRISSVNWPDDVGVPMPLTTAGGPLVVALRRRPAAAPAGRRGCADCKGSPAGNRRCWPRDRTLQQGTRCTPSGLKMTEGPLVPSSAPGRAPCGPRTLPVVRGGASSTYAAHLHPQNGIRRRA
jgi:hypothetical protein